MKRKIFITAAMFFLSIAPVFSESSGWLGGFSVSSEGFSRTEDSFPALSSAEHVGLSLYLEPWSFPFLSPSISAGFLFPADVSCFSSSVFTAGICLEIFSFGHHPFEFFIDIDNAYCPAVELRSFAPLSSFSQWFWGVTVSLFRLKTGAGRYSILSPSFIFDGSAALSGWSLRIFDFRLFLV